jgi:hypothetical protein
VRSVVATGPLVRIRFRGPGPDDWSDVQAGCDGQDLLSDLLGAVGLERRSDVGVDVSRDALAGVVEAAWTTFIGTPALSATVAQPWRRA